MPIISLLPPLLADLIAAGEVVERPCSVVKELWENSIDAGATAVTAEIRGGGLTYIRVSDNGSGMSPEDAGVAFLRHATSKIKTERDLEAIGTLGFRGEALAAISAVSRVELLTRERGAPLGTRLIIEAGDIISLESAGCPVGTVITVTDLFFNTPARLKFIKSDRAEAGACLIAAQKTSLGAPGVSFRFKRDGRDELFTPGDGSVRSAVYSVLGRELAAGMIEIPQGDDSFPRVTGFISSPAAGRGNRSAQYFFVSGRPIRSPAVQAALEQAYKDTLLTGRFPYCALYLETRGGSVDVNVHPAKTEVRFSDERAVFESVYSAAQNALLSENALSVRSAPSIINAHSTPVTREAPERVSPASASVVLPEKSAQLSLHEPVAVYMPSVQTFIPREVPAAQLPPPPLEPILLVGEAMSTYIIVQRGDELIFIDKHAAHERLSFDRFMRQGYAFMSQTLLTPLIYSPGGEAAELLESSSETLRALGFQLDRFGESELIIRAAPAETFPEDAPAILDELLALLRFGGAKDNIGQLLHTVACKAAIKSGKASAPEELLAIARSVLSGEVKYCPHGRPVSFTLSKKDLDKQFKRIV